MEQIVYNQQGKEVGKFTLPERVFGAKWNADLVHQVVTSMQSSARAGTAHTKNRGEVRGGGKKPWRQKGTGRARHGSIRSPIWVGGGVAHGPRKDKNYERTAPRAMRTAALRSVLSAKERDGDIILVDMIAVPEIKTKEARGIIAALSRIKNSETLEKKKTNAALILIPNKDKVVEKSFRNIGNVAIAEARNLNVIDALRYKYMVIVNPAESLKSFV